MAMGSLEVITDDGLRQTIATLCERNKRPHVVLSLALCPEQQGRCLKLSCTTLGGTQYFVDVPSESSCLNFILLVLSSTPSRNLQG